EVCSCVLFFFQAEDGIRDKLVTGVQTCALPISTSFGAPTALSRPMPRRFTSRKARAVRISAETKGPGPITHSRDGRELGRICRAWSRIQDLKTPLIRQTIFRCPTGRRGWDL